MTVTNDKILFCIRKFVLSWMKVSCGIKRLKEQVPNPGKPRLARVSSTRAGWSLGASLGGPPLKTLGIDNCPHDVLLALVETSDFYTVNPESK